MNTFVLRACLADHPGCTESQWPKDCRVLADHGSKPSNCRSATRLWIIRILALIFGLAGVVYGLGAADHLYRIVSGGAAGHVILSFAEGLTWLFAS